MAESVMMWFEATATVDGGHEEGAKRWKMIVGVLQAMGCTDVILRETEHHPDPADEARAARGEGA